uniref:Uncharacterized protein n=1 Tax=Leersia perrieri TaxID=77586 RepID=A0A0D9VLP6_9ORYZ
MASIGYYDDAHAEYGTTTGTFHLFLFLATASLLGAASLYSRCESAMESLLDQARVLLVLSPLLLLLAVQYWTAASAASGSGRRSSSLLVAPLFGDYDQRQRDGSSPWGVALALALVLLLISYQSCFQDWWFPLVNRRR